MFYPSSIHSHIGFVTLLGISIGVQLLIDVSNKAENGLALIPHLEIEDGQIFRIKTNFQLSSGNQTQDPPTQSRRCGE